MVNRREDKCRPYKREQFMWNNLRGNLIDRTNVMRGSDAFLDTRQKVTFDYLGNVIEITEIVLKLKLLLTSRSSLLSKGVPKTDLRHDHDHFSGKYRLIAHLTPPCKLPQLVDN